MSNMILNETISKNLSLPQNGDKLSRFISSKYDTIKDSLCFVKCNISATGKRMVYLSDKSDFLTENEISALTKTRDALEKSLSPFEKDNGLNTEDDLDFTIGAINKFLVSTPIYQNEDAVQLQEMLIEDLITKLPLKLIPDILLKIRQGEYGEVSKRKTSSEIIAIGKKELEEALGLLFKLNAIINCQIPKPNFEMAAKISVIINGGHRHAA